jgi:quercetin dioxygenase-like cupin family protein
VGIAASTPRVEAPVSGYRPSPRPTFDEATALHRADVLTYTWGDEGSGEVQDWLYVSSAKIHELVFGLPPHGSFRHSDEFRTIFAADEVLYVVSGTMMIANPSTGEAHRVEAGDAAFFSRDTWHHAHAIGPEALRVLEMFAPPPAAGTSGTYARSQPLLSEVSLGDDRHLGTFVPGAPLAAEDTIRVVRTADLRWRLEPGSPNPVPVGLFVSTEHLTVGMTDLYAGQRGEWHTHAGDECGYVLEGSLAVAVEGPDARKWFELHPGDGWYVPEGVAHRYQAHEGSTRYVFATAPSYMSSKGRS